MMLILFAALMAGAGNGISIVAFPWLVLQRTGSALDASVVAMAGTLPLLAATLIAGAAVDFLGRRRVSMISDALSAVSVAAVMVGCAAATPRAEMAEVVAPADRSELQAALAAGPVTTGDLELAELAPAPDLSALPPSPWSEEPMTRQDAPAVLLSAWSHAPNREACAPIAPRSLGEGAGARARAGELDGGWSLEFDRRGQRGIGRDGQICERCGRATFGVAGTAMTPEELADLEHGADAPPASFRDGSHAAVSPEEDGVVAATITIAGQGCVYQVWSFLGQAHVEELVRELRRVDVAEVAPTGAMAGL